MKIQFNKTFFSIFLIVSLVLLIAVYKQKEDTPDFCQGDSRFGELSGGGKAFCGPVSVSNILIYLNRHDFPKLFPDDDGKGTSQFKLIKLLSSKDYMNTKLHDGTDPAELMKGLEKYVTEHGYKITIKYKGWHEGGNYSVGKIPNLPWIKNKINSNYNEIFHLGWYKYDSLKNIYKRIGGHYVTVIAVKDDAIVIHDPAVRSGINPKDENCRLVLLKTGTISKWKNNSEHSANGYLKLDGIKLKEGSDCAIIDGVIAFKVYK